MASRAVAGSVYLIDEGRGKPPHYWIVVTDPDHNDEFVIASLTHSINYPANDDVWPVGCPLTPEVTLSKPSVVQMRFVRATDQSWLDDSDAKYLGPATKRSLRRARCNMRWFKDQVQPRPQRLIVPYMDAWDQDCFKPA